MQCKCSSITSNFIAYNPVTNTYAALTKMPTARYRHLACASGTAIYIFGGRTLADALISTVDVFFTTNGTWATLFTTYPSDIGSDNSCSTVVSTVGSTVSSTIYVMGGYDASYSVTYSNIYAFSPTSSTFTKMTSSMITGRGDFSSVTRTDGKISVYGGYTPADFCSPLVSHEVYSPTTNTWATSTALPVGLAEKDDGVIINNRIFSIGGERKALLSGCQDTDIVPLRYVFSFDLTLGLWANETLLPDSRMRFASAEYGNVLYVFGGQGALVDGSYLPVLSTAYSYAPAATAAKAEQTFSVATLAGTAVGVAILVVLLGLAGTYISSRCGCSDRFFVSRKGASMSMRSVV